MGHGVTCGFTVYRVPAKAEYLIIDDGESLEGSRLADILGPRAMHISNGTMFTDNGDLNTTLQTDNPVLVYEDGD